MLGATLRISKEKRMDMNRQTIIFFHLVKTGGITLRNILKRQVPRGRRFYKLSVSSADDAAVLESFKSLPQKEKDQIAVLAGHMPFGLHEYFSAPCDYITILRDPEEVIASTYYYIKNSGPGRYWHKEIPQLGAMSLKDFATADFNLTHNHQTRVLSGEWGTFFAPSQPLALDALRRAKYNLQNNFKAVGVTERFDETLLVMKKIFGWRNIFYFKENTTPTKKEAGAIPPEVREIILKNNELDLKLWKFAGDLLDKSVLRYGPSFQSDLRRFRRANTAYQAVYRIFLFGKALAFHLRLFLGKLAD